MGGSSPRLWLDIEHDEPFQPDSRCRIASLSKTIASAAVMKLVEAGKLDLNDRAFRLLNLEPPSYPGAVNDSRLTNITVRHLLNHTGGWIASTAKNPLGGTGFDAAWWTDWTVQDLGLTPPPTPTDFVRWMMGKPLQANPGSQWSYSNVGFIVAGRVIEKITGQAFEMATRHTGRSRNHPCAIGWKYTRGTASWRGGQLPASRHYGGRYRRQLV